MCTTPKVGDTITAVTTPENATNIAGYAWSINGTAVEGATSATFTVPSTANIGDKIKVVVTDADGKTFESAEATVAEKSDEQTATEVTITDLSGFQTNGTGLVGDVLSLSYGSSLGVPSVVTWYYGEKVVKTATANATTLDDVLKLTTGTGNKADYNEQLKDGKYYATIRNEEGTVFTSNTIELTYDETPATITAFSVNDALDVPAYIDASAKDKKAVVKVTLNKAYTGKFYVYEDSVARYTKNNASAILDLETTNLQWKEIHNVTGMTEKAAIKALSELKTTTAGDYYDGIFYKAGDGKITYMWMIQSSEHNAAPYAGKGLKAAGKETLTRGKDYKIAFDQKNLSEDDITAIGRTDITVSEKDTMEYLTAPASIKVKSVASGQNAVVELLDAEGNVLSYLGYKKSALATNVPAADCTVAGAGFSSFIVAGNSTASTSGASKQFTDGTIVGGVFTSSTTTTDVKDFYYAEAKTNEGVFGEKAATITSEFKAKNAAGASKADLSQDMTTISTAKVAVAGVIAPSTVYVVDKTKNVGVNASFDPADSTTYVNSKEIAAGASSAEITGVFSKLDKEHVYYAVVVPNDESLYARYTGPDFTPVSKATALQINTDTSVTQATITDAGTIGGAVVAAGDTLTLEGNKEIEILDQYGEVASDSGMNVTGVTTAVTANNAGGGKESATAKYSIANGALTVVFTLDANSVIDINDGFTVTVLGSPIKVTAKAQLGSAGAGTDAQAATAAAADDNFDVTVGSSTIIKHTAADLTVNASATAADKAEEYNLVQALAVQGSDATSTAARKVTTTNAISTGDGLSIAKNVTLAMGGKLTLADGAALTNNGTLTLAAAGMDIDDGATVTIAGANQVTAATLAGAANIYYRNTNTTGMKITASATASTTKAVNIGYDADHLHEVVVDATGAAASDTYKADTVGTTAVTGKTSTASIKVNANADGDTWTITTAAGAVS